MTDKPFMPKATAVWLVENTKISFKQIADFCDLHELEIKGIADGDVAKGIKAYNPILAGQLTREEIDLSSKDHARPLKLFKKNHTLNRKKISGTGFELRPRRHRQRAVCDADQRGPAGRAAGPARRRRPRAAGVRLPRLRLPLCVAPTWIAMQVLGAAAEE